MRNHRVNPDQLVLGLIFLGVALAWLLRELGIVSADGLGLIVPLALVTAGLGGLAAFAMNRRQTEPHHNGDPEEYDAE